MISLGRVTWGSSPEIYANIAYEKQRSGTNMQYKIRVSLEPITGSSSFGYPIYLRITLGGSAKSPVTLKNASPSQWGSSITYESDWFTVSNKYSGTTALAVNLYSGGGSSRNSTYSYSLAVDPAGSVLGTIPNFVLGNAIKIPITKYNSSYIDDLEIIYNGTVVKTITWIPNGYEVSFYSTELNSIYALMSTVTSGTFTFKLTTRDSSGTVLGTSTKTATGTITNANPSYSASDVNHRDSDTVVVGITGDSSLIVRNQSNLVISISNPAVGNKGATIVRYEATVNGVTKARVGTGAIDFGKINVASNTSYTVKAIDSRGNSTSVKNTITVLDWIRPATTVEYERLNKFEDNTFLKVNGTFSSLGGRNALTLRYRYKRSGSSTYNDYTIIPEDTQIELILDKNYAWNFQVTATDAFTATLYEFTVPKGTPALFVNFLTERLEVFGKRVPTMEEFLNSLGGTGYQKLPGGLILQWGTVNLTTTATTSISQAITFPIVFPNSCVFASAEVNNRISYKVDMLVPSTTGCTLYMYLTTLATMSASVQNGIFWFAIGY